MIDERLERIFDNLKGAYDDLYDYICEAQNKDHDNSAKILFNWHEAAVKDYAVAAIQAFSNEHLKRELKQVINQLNGILDNAYENADSSEDKAYINDVENRLYEILKQKGLM